MAKRVYREPSDSTKQLQSIKKQGILNPNWGKTREQSVKDKISQQLKLYWSKIPSKNDASTNNI